MSFLLRWLGIGKCLVCKKKVHYDDFFPVPSGRGDGKFRGMVHNRCADNWIDSLFGKIVGGPDEVIPGESEETAQD